jgi:hypothetical protein
VTTPHSLDGLNSTGPVSMMVRLDHHKFLPPAAMTACSTPVADAFAFSVTSRLSRLWDIRSLASDLQVPLRQRNVLADR